MTRAPVGIGVGETRYSVIVLMLIIGLVRPAGDGPALHSGQLDQLGERRRRDGGARGGTRVQPRALPISVPFRRRRAPAVPSDHSCQAATLADPMPRAPVGIGVGETRYSVIVLMLIIGLVRPAGDGHALHSGQLDQLG